MSISSIDEIAATAARLLLTQGFRGVSLRAIASELGIKPASLYHHCPGRQGGALRAFTSMVLG